nr:hypothetical protein [uncultured Acetatifactor sp.]
MKKQKRQMLILLGILVLLGAGFFAVRQYNQNQSLQPQEETPLKRKRIPGMLRRIIP